MTEYSFVIDKDGKQLSPAKVNRAWYLIRKGKALLENKYPLVIRLNKVVLEENIDKSEITCGIDDGSCCVGIGIVQRGKFRNKAVLKGTIKLREDVKHLMDVRRGYRRYRRYHKGYRQKRFYNRYSGRRTDRVLPSIKQKKESIVRVIKRLMRLIRIDRIVLEDVLIDIRSLCEGRNLTGTEYQKSNRPDENLRIACLRRDEYKCRECGRNDCKLEAHHIRPKRLKGSDSIYNLITLCGRCHKEIEGMEEKYMDRYCTLIKGQDLRLDIPQHVMQGKNYLREELKKLSLLELTTGGNTANRRKGAGFSKTHSNDALVITGLTLAEEQINLKDWFIKPMRRKSKAVSNGLCGLKHRDLIKYIKRDGTFYTGYITAFDPERDTVNITTIDNRILKRYSINRCKLLWRFNKIWWL